VPEHQILACQLAAARTESVPTSGMPAAQGFPEIPGAAFVLADLTVSRGKTVPEDGFVIEITLILRSAGNPGRDYQRGRTGGPRYRKRENSRAKPYNHSSMTVTVRSLAKINLGLRIGASRPDGFHELLTVYQTIGLHDVIGVSVGRGSGIEIRCEDERVPRDETNTCHRIASRAMEALRARGRVVIEIEKRLPVQGGLGGASANAVATLLGLERALKRKLAPEERLRIAAEVGSDLPLFLVGGTVLGVGRNGNESLQLTADDRMRARQTTFLERPAGPPVEERLSTVQREMAT